MFRRNIQLQKKELEKEHYTYYYEKKYLQYIRI